MLRAYSPSALSQVYVYKDEQVSRLVCSNKQRRGCEVFVSQMEAKEDLAKQIIIEARTPWLQPYMATASGRPGLSHHSYRIAEGH